MNEKKYLLLNLLIVFLFLFSTNVKALKINEITNNFYSSVYRTISTTLGIDMKNILTDESYFEVNNERIINDEIKEVPFGSPFKFYLVWKIPNDLDWAATDIFVYEFPKEIKFNNANGKLKDNTNEVGQYEIQDNILTISYYEEFVQNAKGNNNIVGTLSAEGILNAEELWQNDGENLELDFPGFGNFNLLITPDIQYGDINLFKFCDDEVLDDDHTSFQINVDTIKHDFDEIVIEDTYGQALSSLKDLTVYDKNNNDITKDCNIVNQESGFNITIKNVQAGDIFKIKYNLDINEEKNEQRDDMQNKAVGTVKNNYSELSHESVAYAKSKEKSSISKSVQIDGNIASYTININGMSDLQNQTLTDELSEGQKYIEGTLQVKENGKPFSDLTYEQLTKGYEFTKSNAKYTITYDTEITCEECYISNSARLTSPAGILEDATEEYFNNANLSKEAIDYDKGNRVITWQSIFEFQESNDLKNGSFKLTDVFNESKLEYVEDSFQINGKKYNVSQDEWSQGFKFFSSFDELGTGPYTITYKTKVKPGIDALNLENDISVQILDNGPTYFATAKYSEEGIKLKQITKSYMSSADMLYQYKEWNTKCTSESEKCMQYIINIKQLDKDINDFYIVDKLPDNTTGVVDNIYLKPLNNSSLPNYYNYEWNQTKPILIEKMADNKIKFVFQDETILENLKQDEYFLSYTIYANDDLYGAHTFKNTAYPYVDGKEGEMTASIANKVFAPPIVKKFDYDQDSAPAAKYTLELNDYALDLDPTSDELILVDESGHGLDFIRGTLRVNDQIWQDYNYDDETNKLIIKVPDETKLNITYTTYVNLMPRTKFTYDNSHNSVKINNINGAPSITLQGNALEVNGTTSGIGGSITIYKYLNNNKNKGLGGIEFTIYKANTITENDIITVDKKNPYAEEFTKVTTSSEEEEIGYARVSNLKFDQVYVIHETKKEEYEPSEDIYFVIAGHDNKRYDNKNINIYSSDVINSIININNNQINNIQILKVDENDILLKNAKLQIKDKKGKVIEEWITDGNEHDVIEHLNPNEKYILHEVEAPAGYELADDIEFTVKETQELQQIKMIDKKIKMQEEIQSPPTGDRGILQYIIISIVAFLIIAILITSLVRNKKAN